MAPLRTRLPDSARAAGARALHALVAIPCLPILLVAALLARLRRPSRKRRARIVWGPQPLLSYAHWSRAMRKAKTDCRTKLSSSQ